MTAREECVVVSGWVYLAHLIMMHPTRLPQIDKKGRQTGIQADEDAGMHADKQTSYRPLCKTPSTLYIYPVQRFTTLCTAVQQRSVHI